jgi:hypothetical protein
VGRAGRLDRRVAPRRSRIGHVARLTAGEAAPQIAPTSRLLRHVSPPSAPGASAGQDGAEVPGCCGSDWRVCPCRVRASWAPAPRDCAVSASPVLSGSVPGQGGTRPACRLREGRDTSGCSAQTQEDHRHHGRLRSLSARRRAGRPVPPVVVRTARSKRSGCLFLWVAKALRLLSVNSSGRLDKYGLTVGRTGQDKLTSGRMRAWWIAEAVSLRFGR